MTDLNLRTAALLEHTPMMPIMVIEDISHAAPVAQALVRGGLTVFEVTLRTDCALEAIRRMRAAAPGALVGAGTVKTPAQVKEALEAGAQFLVTPGVTPALLDALLESGVPFFPGAVTASEVMALLERGIRYLKFFPAESSGGVAALKALAGPLPDARFCPTGGIDAARAVEYLKLPNVVCVGGSWVTPTDALKRGDWTRIEALAAEASRLGSGNRP